MARIARSMVCGAFSASVLLLGACSHAHDDSAAPTAKPDKETIAKWLDRAEQYAASLPEAQLAHVLPTLCGPMVAGSKDGHVDRLLATIKDPTRRADQGLLVCMALAQTGKYDAALRRAQSLPTERRTSPSGGKEKYNSWRDGAIYTVALTQSWAYDFAEAKRTMRLIDDPQTLSSAYRYLAQYQAKAGLYAEAAANLEKVVANTEYEKNCKEEIRQLIARYKASGKKDPPRQRQETCYESLRRVSTIFSDSGFKLDNVAQAEVAEKAADEEKGASNKATAWRNIAWAYYDMRNADKKNLERCRRAIDKSLQNAEEIPDGLGDSYSRAVALASAANLYLELGETDLAKQAVKKAGAINLDADLLGGLSSFTTTPLLIAVLVRVGDIDGAREIADKLQKTVDKEKADAPSFGSADIAWLFWATACTLEGKTASVERQLEKIDNARTKAVLCAGVATGLLELQQRPARRKP